MQLGASQFVVSHPQLVKEAIDRYRKQLDEEPVLYTEKVENENMQRVREIATHYFDIPNPDDIAMTGTTRWLFSSTA